MCICYYFSGGCSSSSGDYRSWFVQAFILWPWCAYAWAGVLGRWTYRTSTSSLQECRRWIQEHSKQTRRDCEKHWRWNRLQRWSVYCLSTSWKVSSHFKEISSICIIIFMFTVLRNYNLFRPWVHILCAF